MNQDAVKHPKLFISYSWTSAAHEEWVLELAHELASNGIEVILDKWGLREGHDANAFMESMVSDPTVTKVVLICDKTYAEKSDARRGGAGTEAQIITPELYAKRDQSKFVAVIREKNEDGTPCLPIYYKGRIYINLADDSDYAQQFERLVRWAWDKPQFVKPKIGDMPLFLAQANAPKLNTTIAFRRALDAVRSGRENAAAALSDYFDVVVRELENFRLVPGSGDFDEQVTENIEQFVPYRNELIEIFLSIAKASPSEDSTKSLHRFVEALIPYLDRPENMNSYKTDQFDNFKFIVHEIFLYIIGTLLKYERFNAAQYLLDTEYYQAITRAGDDMVPFTRLYNHMESFEARSRRLGRTSARADILKARCQAVGLDFRHLLSADFVLYLRAAMTSSWAPWWPETLIFVSPGSATMEIFARARSAAYFERIRGMLGTPSVGDFRTRVAEMSKDQRGAIGWRYHRVSVSNLARIEELCTRP
ncbi:SEFIR domain protein [Bosea sp. LC85]|uniref:SEFIR domain-containing protein n=1 Tax=Bosea sp. LC85 TaxID=1502851 RepID=UPI0004E33393|nr:SEFIR domain-containing protein [Bosea sp. LC85]KFC65056.1 SEFIR domain protein [Bosea sp. LC85]